VRRIRTLVRGAGARTEREQSGESRSANKGLSNDECGQDVLQKLVGSVPVPDLSCEEKRKRADEVAPERTIPG
jgi:hypothetical protein